MVIEMKLIITVAVLWGGINCALRYPTDEESEQILQQMTKLNSTITILRNIGNLDPSPDGDFVAQSLTIGKSASRRPFMTPIVRFYSDNPIGRVVLLRFGETILNDANNGNATAIDLITRLHIELVPSIRALNPIRLPVPCDIEQIPRAKIEHKLPDFFDSSNFSLGSIANISDVTIAWLTGDSRPALTVALKSGWGVLGVEYPFRGYPTEKNDDDNPFAEAAAFRKLGSAYASANPHLRHTLDACNLNSRALKLKDKNVFEGRAWRPRRGSLEDFAYVYGGSMSLTAYISCCFRPDQKSVDTIVKENVDALYSLLLVFLSGLGSVYFKTQNGNHISNVRITKTSLPFPLYASTKSEFFRYVLKKETYVAYAPPRRLKLFTLASNSGPKARSQVNEGDLEIHDDLPDFNTTPLNITTSRAWAIKRYKELFHHSSAATSLLSQNKVYYGVKDIIMRCSLVVLLYSCTTI